MALTIVGAFSGLQLTAVVVEVVDIAVNLHDAALELACISGIVPGTVPLNPSGTHNLVLSKEEPVVLVVHPVIGTVISGTPLIFCSL